MRQTESLELRRGDLVWVNCEPSVGAQPRKVRTRVVVSNDIANRIGQTVTVVPTQRYTPERNGRAYMVDLRPPKSNLKTPRIADASMVTTFDRSRVLKREGRVSQETLGRLDDALRIHLALEG